MMSYGQFLRECLKIGFDKPLRVFGHLRAIATFCGFVGLGLAGYGVVKPGTKHWLDACLIVVPSAVFLVLLMRSLFVAPYNVCKAAWQKSADLEASYKQQLEAKEADRVRAVKEFGDFQNEHQALNIKAEKLIQDGNPDIVLHISNPSKVTAAVGMKLKYLGIVKLGGSYASGDKVTLVDYLFERDEPGTLNAGENTRLNLFRFGLVDLPDRKSVCVFNGRYLAGREDVTTLGFLQRTRSIKPINTFHIGFKFAAYASGRPPTEKQFVIDINWSEAGFDVVVDELPARLC